jgi:hypothetical protein
MLLLLRINLDTPAVATDSSSGQGFLFLTHLLQESTTPTSRLKYWNGSTWQAKVLKNWNGSTWQTKTLKRWNGSTWIQ